MTTASSTVRRAAILLAFVDGSPGVALGVSMSSRGAADIETVRFDISGIVS